MARHVATGPWLLASAALIMLQAAFGFTWPAQAWITALGIGMQFVLGCTFCVYVASRSGSGMRRKWLLVAIAFSLFAGGFAGTLWGEYVLRIDPQVAWIQDIFFTFRSLPLLLALCWSEDGHMNIEQWIDVAKVLLIAVLLILFVFPSFSLRPVAGVVDTPESTVVIFLDAANAVISGIALLALLAARMDEALRMAQAISAFSLSYTIAASFLNHVVIREWNAPSGSPWFVLGSLAVMFFFSSLHGTSHKGAHLRFRKRFTVAGRIIRLSSPIVYAASAFLLTVAAVSRGTHVAVSITLGLLSLLLYGLRTARLQLRYERARHNLEDVNRALDELAKRDPLTGLRNRRWFAHQVQHLWNADQGREAFPLSLLLIDVDYFKKYNDQHGHTRGDECLIHLASILAVEAKSTDGEAARYGGEEFAIIQPRTSMEEAAALAERICQAVRSAGMLHPSSPHGIVSVSVGLSTFLTSAPESLMPGLPASEMMILLADAALYEAKRLGRNRVHAIHTP